MGPITPDDHKRLVAETNARLRNIGVVRKLDPGNAFDKQVLIPAWLAAYGDLEAQFINGTFTFDPWDAAAPQDFTDYTNTGIAAAPPVSPHASVRPSAHAPAITPDVQKKLYAETDARFRAQSGIAKKLDPKNPLDQKLIPAWLDAFGKVKAEYLTGAIHWTYDHPFVGPALAAAEGHAARAADHMEAAAARARAVTARAVTAPVGALGPDDFAEHVAAARTAHDDARRALASAAAQQPPTVSHAHVQHAAHQMQQFVMNGAGQGVPVIANGVDATTFMQVQAAPANTAAMRDAFADWDMTGGFGGPAQLEDFTTPLRTHDTHTSGKAYAIGVAVLGAVALATWGLAKHGERKHPRARRRLPDGRLYSELHAMDPRRRLA